MGFDLLSYEMDLSSVFKVLPGVALMGLEPLTT
jgi:hypothetical protein